MRVDELQRFRLVSGLSRGLLEGVCLLPSRLDRLVVVRPPLLRRPRPPHRDPSLAPRSFSRSCGRPPFASPSEDQESLSPFPEIRWFTFRGGFSRRPSASCASCGVVEPPPTRLPLASAVRISSFLGLVGYR